MFLPDLPIVSPEFLLLNSLTQENTVVGHKYSTEHQTGVKWLKKEQFVRNVDLGRQIIPMDKRRLLPAITSLRTVSQ